MNAIRDIDYSGISILAGAAVVAKWHLRFVDDVLRIRNKLRPYL